MKIIRINEINFKENTLSKEMNSADAVLMLRDANAAVKFRQNQEYARKADSVDTNPVVALGYKLYRTFRLLSESNHSGNLDKVNYQA